MMNKNSNFPELGFGLGLRSTHYPHILKNLPKIDWFEIISENYMDTDGRPKRNLARIKEHYPIVMHGVSLSIGTVDPLNSEYLKKLKELIKWLNPVWVSDHLCWTGIAHKNSHDLLPTPYTEEALEHIIKRIKMVQDFLERPIALENPSTYLEFKSSEMPESEFMARMVNESGCNLLLDVNNVYVTCYNHRLDPKKYIDALPLDKVIQIHLSGHTNKGNHIVDTHDDHVIDEVWALYKYVVHKAGRVPNTMVEWDENIPKFSTLYGELKKAKKFARDAKNFAPLPKFDAQKMRGGNYFTSLEEAQKTMQNAILFGEKKDAKPDLWVHPKEEFSAADQLAVYVNGYRYRLYAIVSEDYPVLKKYFGEEKFDELLNDFIENVHSDHFNISRFATKLSAFLATHKFYDKFAYELCQLETSVAQMLDPLETAPLKPEDLQNLSEEVLMEKKLYPRFALELFAFENPVNDYFINVKEKARKKIPTKRENFVAVFRHEDAIWRLDLEKNEYLLLKKLFAGCPIGKAITDLHSELKISEDELAQSLSDWFARWIRNGLLAKI